MPLAHFHRLQIDAGVDYLLTEFYLLPNENDAIEALRFVAEQKTLPVEAAQYETLPRTYSEERFQRVKDKLAALHQMMQNRQPQNGMYPPYPGASHLEFGIFNLTSDMRGGEVMAEEVRDYLREKFQAIIWTLEILRPVLLPHLNVWKQKNHPEYVSALTEWIKKIENTAEEEMPEKMQQIVRSRGILLINIKAKLREKYPAITDEHIENIIKNILALPYAVIGKLDQHAAALRAIFLLKPIPGNNVYCAVHLNVLKKMRRNSSSPALSDAVLKSFVAAERVYTFLYFNQKTLPSSFGELTAAEIRSECVNYFKQLLEMPVEEMQPLSDETIKKLKLFYKKALEEVAFFKDLFAVYFISDQKDEYFAKLLQMDLTENRFFLSDEAWVTHIMLSNASKEEQKSESAETAIDLTPYQINRLILHACFIHPNDWSPAFAFAFERVLKLLDPQKKEDALNQALKKSSYPEGFFLQLVWLLNVHKAYRNGNKQEISDVVSLQPVTYFPLFFYFPGGDELRRILSYSSVENRAQFLNKIKEHPFVAIEDFLTVLHALQPSERAVFLWEDCAETIPHLINSVDDLNKTLRALRSGEHEKFLEKYKDIVRKFVTTLDNFRNTVFLLDRSDYEIVRDFLLKTFPDLFPELRSGMKVTTTHPLGVQHLIIYVSPKEDKLPENIPTAEKFNHVFSLLVPEKRTDVYESLRGKENRLYLPNRDTAKQFYQVLEYLTPAQRIEVFNRTDYSKMFSEIQDFMYVFTLLPTEQQIKAWRYLDNPLDNPLDGSRWNVFKKLDDFDTVSAFSPVLRDKIDNLKRTYIDAYPFQTIEDFCRTVRGLNPNQYPEFFHRMLLLRLPELIHTPEDIFSLIVIIPNPYPYTYLQSVFSAIEEKILDLAQKNPEETVNAFVKKYSDLPSGHRINIMNFFEERLGKNHLTVQKIKIIDDFFYFSRTHKKAPIEQIRDWVDKYKWKGKRENPFRILLSTTPSPGMFQPPPLFTVEFFSKMVGDDPRDIKELLKIMHDGQEDKVVYPVQKWCPRNS